jgi:hypothetical protein
MTAGIGQNGHRDPGPVISGSSKQARQERAAHRHNRRALLVIGLSAVARLLRDRGFQAMVITGAIGAAALASTAREGKTNNLARLTNWDKKQSLRGQHKAAAHH